MAVLSQEMNAEGVAATPSLLEITVISPVWHKEAYVWDNMIFQL